MSSIFNPSPFKMFRSKSNILPPLLLLMLLLPPPAARAQSPSYPSPIIIYNSNLACQIEEPKQGLLNDDGGICLKVCENTSETYSVNANPNSSYLWSVTGGAIVGSSTATSINVTWGPAGRGSVSVTETLDGSQATANLCVDIVSSPSALFTVPPINEHSFCLKQEVAFLDASTVQEGTIVAWVWDFGDGSHSNEQNPTHSWNTPGTYTVSLTVYNECHCYSTYSYTVYINSGTPVSISCPSIACENQRTSYTADCDCGGQWFVKGGQIVSSAANQVEVLWNDPASLVDGFGIVSYSTPGCPDACSQFATVKIPVITENAAINGETNVCVNKQYHYSLPAWPATLFEWQVDNPAIAAIVDPKDKDIFIDFLADGIVTLSARYYNTMTHCSGTASLSINVLPQTFIDASIPIDEVCQGSTATFSRMAGGTAISGSWSVLLPDGTSQSASGTSFPVTFSLPGTYVISVTGGSYCAAEPVTISVRPKPNAPTAILGETFVCPGFNYDYTVSPYDPSLTYLWSFANPNDGVVLNSEGDKATVVWNNAPGTLQVQAMLTEAPFCISDYASLQVQHQFDADYSIAVVGSSPCGHIFELQRNGSPFLTASNYEWELVFPSFPDNTFASIVNGPYHHKCDVQAHHITSPEQCTVRCHYWICDSEFVAATVATFDPTAVTPVVSISPSSPVCSDTPVTFSVSNHQAFSSITWRHGGDTQNGSSYTTEFHNYSNSIANEQITVECTTACGQMSCQSFTIQVHPAIQASLHFNPVGSQLIVDHDPTSAYSYDWYYNGSTLSCHSDVLNIPYGQYGDYTCEVTDGTCTLSLDYHYGASLPPCGNYAINLIHNNCGTVTASVPTNTFSQVHWLSSPNFQVSSVSSDGCTATYTATHAGDHFIQAEVSTPTCTSILSLQVTVKLVASFSLSYACIGNTPHVYLHDNSSCYPYGGTISTFVDGNPFTNSCDLTTLLGLSAGDACSFTATASSGNSTCAKNFNITLPDRADASFTLSPNPACVNNYITLKPNNQNFPSYSWDLAGATSTRIIETRSFSTPSQPYYNIILTVTDEYGCTDTKNQTVEVNANMLQGKIETNTIPVCLGTPVTLKYKNHSAQDQTALNSYSYNWNPTTPLSYIPPYNKTVMTPTLYTLTASDRSGCEFKMGPNGAKIIVPATPIISGRTDICQNEKVSLHSICGNPATMPYNTYQWYCDGTAIPAPIGTQPDLLNYTITTTPGSHTFQLYVTYAGIGCTANNSVVVNVHPAPARPIINPNPTYNCNPYAVTMQVSNVEPTGTYCWSNGDNGSSITVPEGGAFNVTYISPYGCKTTSNDIVIARSPESYFWTFPTGCYVMCPGDTLEVHGPAKFWDNNIWKWEFFKDGSSIASGDRNYPGLDDLGLDPHLVITGAGSYDMTLNNGPCAETVGSADVSMAASCSSCSIYIKSYKFCLQPDGTVILYLDVFNSEPIPLNYNIVIHGGLVYTANGTLQPGLNSIAPIFVPYGIVSVGTLLMGRITASNPDPNTMRCYADFEYPVEECGKGTGLHNDSSNLLGSYTGAPFDFRLTPNPTRGGAYASFSGVSGSHLYVCVIDMKGQEMLRHDVSDGEQRVFLEVNNLPHGVYMVCLVSDTGPLSCLKLIKQ